MNEPGLSQDSPMWIAYTQIAFVVSLTAMVIGICYLPVQMWIRGYLGIGLFFAISSTVVLSKTMRDLHEAKKLINKIHEVKTERILKEFDPIK